MLSHLHHIIRCPLSRCSPIDVISKSSILFCSSYSPARKPNSSSHNFIPSSARQDSSLTGLPQIMPLRALTASKAGDLDKELMETHKFSIDQLMELAGLSVAQALYTLYPPSSPGAYPTVLVVCGPGNNGGDGLVAARHLAHFGYIPVVHYPKRSSNELYGRLVSQLKGLGVGFIKDMNLDSIDYVIDSIFGFSFSGEVREPFPAIIKALEETKIPVLAVDVPSSWDVEKGPPESGPGKKYMPTALISLTAPKPAAKFFKGRHFVGGRFLSQDMAEKYGVNVPPYKGYEQILEIDVGDAKL